jgi:hypothetical protein
VVAQAIVDIVIYFLDVQFIEPAKSFRVGLGLLDELFIIHVLEHLNTAECKKLCIPEWTQRYTKMIKTTKKLKDFLKE